MKISEFINRLELYCEDLENGLYKNSADNPAFIRSNIDKCKRYMKEILK